MRRRALVQALPDKGLAEQQLYVLFGPRLGRQALEEHHDFLKVHFCEFVGPLHEKGGADVEMEFGEALLFGLWGVERMFWLVCGLGGAERVSCREMRGVMDSRFF